MRSFTLASPRMDNYNKIRSLPSLFRFFISKIWTERTEKPIWDVILTEYGVSFTIHLPGGGVAQLVRASGSYPLCPGFESLHRYQIMLNIGSIVPPRIIVRSDRIFSTLTACMKRK